MRLAEIDARTSQRLAQRLRVFHALVSAGLRIDRGSFNAAVSIAPDEYRASLVGTWQFATTLGVPSRAILDAVIRALDDDVARARRISQAVAGPAMATRIVLTLPAVSLVVLGSLGFNAVGLLFTTPLGWTCLFIALIFTSAGLWWSNRLIAQARKSKTLPGFGLALIAIGLASGIGFERIVNVMSQTGLNRQARLQKEVRQARAVMHGASQSGIPMAQLLASIAQAERDRENAAVATRLEKLGEKILLPLGACILPAFIVLVAVPAVASSLFTTTPVLG